MAGPANEDGPATARTIRALTGQMKTFKKYPKSGEYTLFEFQEGYAYGYIYEADITKCIIMLIGGQGTPYEGGFFFYNVTATGRYPYGPPHATYLTTSYGKVRFNPNFYENGKCCLSILGTWAGDPWVPTYTMATVANTLLLRLNENPIVNEPSYEKCPADSPKAIEYNEYVYYNTIEFAIMEQMNMMDKWYPQFCKIVIHMFAKNVEMIKRTLKAYSDKYPAILHKTTSVYHKTQRYDWPGLNAKFLDFADKFKALHP